MLLQTYTMACLKWRKNCNGRTQNRWIVMVLLQSSKIVMTSIQKTLLIELALILARTGWNLKTLVTVVCSILELIVESFRIWVPRSLQERTHDAMPAALAGTCRVRFLNHSSTSWAPSSSGWYYGAPGAADCLTTLICDDVADFKYFWGRK